MEESTISCPNCGVQNKNLANSCSHCGGKLSSEGMPPVTPRNPQKRGLGKKGFNHPIVIVVTAFMVLLLTSMTACTIGSGPASTATPTTTVTPVPTATPVRITTDQDLAEIINAANDGETITLAPGQFTLAQGIDISKNLTLVGAGYDQTTITSNVPGQEYSAMIMYSGTGTLSIQGIKLSYTGADPATVVYMNSGNLALRDCYIDGATVSSSGSQLGAVHLANDAKANITDCHIAGSVNRANAEAPDKIPGGIMMYGNSQLVIEGSEIFDSYLGIYAFGEADVTARNNTFRNAYAGVTLLENAAGILEGNAFTDHTGVHLAFFGDSTGIVTGNSFTGTEESIGIQVNENANVHLENNTFSDVTSGILFLGNTTGEAVGNELTAFSNAGIFVDGAASPTLEGNIISNDAYGVIGITYQGNASGEARGNNLSNLYVGISLDEQAAPLLESNEILYCETGILYEGEASGSAVSNTIQFGFIGILIDSPASPTITNNTIQAMMSSLLSDPEDWINQIPVADNALQDGEPEIIIVTVTPKP